MGNDQQAVITENWEKRIDTCIKILKQWSKRKLTYRGKILVANTLASSSLWYTLSVTSMPDNYVIKVKNAIINFFWSDKKHLIKYSVITNYIRDGGLNLIDIDIKKGAFRLKWVKKIMDPSFVHKCKHLMLYNLNKYRDFKLGYGIFKINIDRSKCSNLPPFYAEILKSWALVANNNRCRPTTPEAIMQEPLFCNQFVSHNDKMLLFQDFVSANVVKVKDLSYEFVPGLLPSAAVSELVAGLLDLKKSCDARKKYSIIRNALPLEWLQTCFTSVCSHKQDTVSVVLKSPTNKNITIAEQTTKQLTTLIHDCLIKRSPNLYKPTCMDFWLRKFPGLDFRKIWQNIYGGIKENNICDLEYLCIHNVLTTNTVAYKAGTVDSPLCSFCKQENETILHLFTECPTIQELLSYVFKIIFKISTKSSNIDIQQSIIFGFPDKSDKYNWAIINYLLGLAKCCINTRRYIYINNKHTLQLIPYFKRKLEVKVQFDYERYQKWDDLIQFENLYANNNSIVRMDGIDYVLTLS